MVLILRQTATNQCCTTLITIAIQTAARSATHYLEERDVRTQHIQHFLLHHLIIVKLVQLTKIIH